MKRHRFDPTAFVPGVVFAVLAIVFGLDAMDAWSGDAVWIVPVVCIAAGLGLLVSTVARQRRHADEPS
jgi:hypothetical protein